MSGVTIIVRQGEPVPLPPARITRYGTKPLRAEGFLDGLFQWLQACRAIQWRVASGMRPDDLSRPAPALHDSWAHFRRFEIRGRNTALLKNIKITICVVENMPMLATYDWVVMFMGNDPCLYMRGVVKSWKLRRWLENADVNSNIEKKVAPKADKKWRRVGIWDNADSI